MSDFCFEIPSNLKELLNDTENYNVRSLVVMSEMAEYIKAAKCCLRDEGAEFILQTFDTYYSILHFADTLPSEMLSRAYEDLHKGLEMLNISVAFLLEDKQSIVDNQELQTKYANVLKMLVYLYTETVLMIDQKNTGTIPRKKQKKNEENAINKSSIVVALHTLIQLEISVFWDPPIVEDNFLSLVSRICYKFLNNPSIKSDRNLQQEIFSLLGTLIINYNQGTTFKIQIVQMLKSEEHLVQCLAEGVRHLVEKYNCKGLVHDLICELTEWQTEDRFQDSQGSKYCAQVLTSMAALMPDLMIPELAQLTKYLAYDSTALRISVLNVIFEVILNVLSKPELTEDQIQLRNDFFTLLIDHLNDIAAHARSKVIQHFARLQEEGAIPSKYINEVLRNIIEHLHDKAALARKSAASCVTSFLSHNHFGANLSVSSLKEELAAKKALFEVEESKIQGIKNLKLDEMQQQWDTIVANLKPIIDEDIENGESDDSDDEEENAMNCTEVAEMLRLYLNEGKYKEAFKMLKELRKHSDDGNQDTQNLHSSDFYMLLCQRLFLNPTKIFNQIQKAVEEGTITNVTEEDLNNITQLQQLISFLEEAVAFVELIGSAVPLMAELLETPSISDMQEAVQFFVATYHFKIDNTNDGIMAMFRMMERNEPERRDILLKAFKNIYLVTDNSKDHCDIVTGRLIDLLKTITFTNEDNLELIISEWVAKGILDNNIIDTLWQYFLGKKSYTNDERLGSVKLLRMAAKGRNTIILRNIKVVITAGFTDQDKNNMVFLGEVCEFLSVAGQQKADVTSNTPPFKIKWTDPVFKDLFQILLSKFFEPVPYYQKALRGALKFVYKLCTKPDKLCQDFIKQILEGAPKSPDTGKIELDVCTLLKLCNLLGLVAINQLEYLDETVYKELKRRENKSNKRKATKPKISALSTNSLNTSTAEQLGVEGFSGTEAFDADAEFIAQVLEKETVTGGGVLARLAHFVKEICEKPNVYNDTELQQSAIGALSRYMLVSNEFCKANIQLLFTILAQTTYPHVKVSIVVHTADLLVRFPNTVDPWTPHIYKLLKDPSAEIRRTSFWVLSGMILRDLIRAHSYISNMAECLIDEDEQLTGLCRTFFRTLASKENNLYNALPDIFSYLMESPNVNDEQVKECMKFMFKLIDKSKHMENLVIRFCTKFPLTEDINYHRVIAFCLTLIEYNDKAFKNLHENFPIYKHLLHDPEIYTSFKTIFNNCGKQQTLKPLVAEMEKSIGEVFELNENGEQPKSPPRTGKQQRKRTKKTKKTQAKDNDENELTTSRTTRKRKVLYSKEFDSD